VGLKKGAALQDLQALRRAVTLSASVRSLGTATPFCRMCNCATNKDLRARSWAFVSVGRWYRRAEADNGILCAGDTVWATETVG
jgi:hypothetical protein